MNKKRPDNRESLLNELDHLRGLLGEEGEDVHLDDLPLLDTDGADSDGQLPLLQSETAPSATKSAATQSKAVAPAPQSQSQSQSQRNNPKNMQQALSERVNPFLKNAGDAIAAKQVAKQPAASKATTPSQAAAPLLTESQISRLVDSVVEECLPHVEQTLRVHLTAALHRQNRNN